jgi:hypothetical protein
MRTKTLLLTAALTAAGVATSMAQVYSVNMVGYINVTIPAGFSMLANHLNNSPDNLVITLLPSPPEGTRIFKFNPVNDTYDQILFLGGVYEGDMPESMTLGPGEGVFIDPPSSFTHTFVGEVQLQSTVNLLVGPNMVSSVLPQSLPLDGLANDGNATPPAGLGFVPAEGDRVFKFKPSNDTYDQDLFLGGVWEGDSGGAAPVPGISEAFWIDSSATASYPRSWSRNFVVGVD